MRIHLDDGLARLCERLTREAAPALVEALEEELGKIMTHARANWPVGQERTLVGDTKVRRRQARDLPRPKGLKSGDPGWEDYVEANRLHHERGEETGATVGQPRRPHSRDLLEQVIQVDPGSGTITGKIVIDTKGNYAVKIKSDKNGLGGGSPWQILVRKPVRAAAKVIAKKGGAKLKVRALRGR